MVTFFEMALNGRIKSCSHSFLLGPIIALCNRHMFKCTCIVTLNIVKSVNHRLATLGQMKYASQQIRLWYTMPES
jgi:hypothetical protein